MYWASRRVNERRTLPFSEATKVAASTALQVAAGKVSRLMTDYPNYLPLYTDHGDWKHGSLVADDDLAQRYHSHAEATLVRLREPEFVAYEDSWEGVLKHGSYHETKHLGVDESVMWGEYFFVETLAYVVQAP